MKLKVIQLNFGYDGGSASACLYGPEPASAFDRRPHLAIHMNFTLHRDPPHFDCATQDLVVLPPGIPTPYLCVGFLSDPPMFADHNLSWPQPSEYRNKLAQAIAKMVTVAIQTNDADC